MASLHVPASRLTLCKSGRISRPFNRRRQVSVHATAMPAVPERKFLDDAPESHFRNGRPAYDVVNSLYLNGKTRDWQPGSLEWIVESVVKTFEMEISHKTKAEYIQSFAPGFTYSQNGGPKIDGTELIQRGSYNVLINDGSYASQNMSFEESHDQFKSAFPTGFAFEVLEVMSGPPSVTFKWRHWGKYDGAFVGFAPTGKVFEMVGMAIAKVNDKLQIEDLQIFYDATPMLDFLQEGGKCPLGFGSKDNAVASDKTQSSGFLSAITGFFKN